jgi:hypothetical protein
MLADIGDRNAENEAMMIAIIFSLSDKTVYGGSVDDGVSPLSFASASMSFGFCFSAAIDSGTG